MARGSTVREAFKKFFEEPPQDLQAIQDGKEWADATLALWEQKAFRDLVDEIAAMGNQQIPVGPDVAAMAGQIGESNGIKKVVARMKSDLLRARRITAATGRGPGE